MRLQNCEICSSIEFQSGGLFWDVHNFARFDGLELIRAENVAVMRWSVPTAVTNPWGGYGNKFAGMELHFKNLLFLPVGPRDEEMPMSEDSCVSDVLMVDPAIEHDDPYMRQVQEVTDSFRLVFLFQSACNRNRIGSRRIDTYYRGPFHLVPG
jgi:hypothetical protein